MQEFGRSEPPQNVAYPIAKEGLPYILTSAFVTLVMALLQLKLLSILLLILTFFICYFFRDPDRLIPLDPQAIVSPADGKIIRIEDVNDNLFEQGDFVKVSIFMSVFNVHVNRIPLDGRLKNLKYNPGKFFSANLDKASKDNEQNALLIETAKGYNLSVVQIAGLIARRIICKIQVGDELTRGRRFGLICFGSRLDVYLPNTIKINVQLGDTVSAGTSILGFYS